MSSRTFRAVYADFPSEKITIGAGVAIFHIASERVVVCYDPQNRCFLPKGRKNANEAVTTAAEREGYEESGYRNRLIPIPMEHRAPDPDEGHQEFVTEPIWVELLPLSKERQYILYWYAAETVSSDIERMYADRGARAIYRPPPAFPPDLSVQDRIDQDTLVDTSGEKSIYEPVRHEGTGVDEEEAQYRSELLPVNDAIRRLSGTVMADVVSRGWGAIRLKSQLEVEHSASSGSRISS